MASILTNAAAMAALQTLRAIDRNLETTQARVSSGLRVETAADNAAYWSIATTMRSDNRALSTVQDALGLGAAKVDTAYAAMESAIEVVQEIKAKLVAAYGVGTDRTKIQEEINQLQEQLKSISESASFSGENWLQEDISDGAVPPTPVTVTKQVVASFIRNASGTVGVTTVDYPLNEDTVLFDTSGGNLGILDKLASNGTTSLGFSVVTLDITDLDTVALQLDIADPPGPHDDADALDAMTQFVDGQLEAMTSAASSLGSIQSRIDMQEDFVATLIDTIDTGVGRLVDADMNEESTRLQALQTQQQLAIQSLSIANTNSQNILQLFQQ
ncbi:flagellin [Mycoplana sp. MJR14]|jgi:flagellin|uniref:flagellin N-terminal helical domain-containing protein n=1 Tax=Mycoplana sp. MJR14 TaxID=3032583 RepID=UPI000DD560F6|nr:flagellin [Mycoplana sp. MJR14]MDF1630977.1 flagellin [Mycoplana sp. MJR14]